MRRRAVSLGALALTGALLLVGCGADDDASDGTTATTAEPTTKVDETPTSSVPSGTIADVDFTNFTFDYPSAASEDDSPLQQVTVVDGEFTSGEAPDTFYFEMVDVDLADLDGDGIEEAAVTIYYNTGGSGQFTDVLIYRWKDDAAVYVTHDGVGDRGDGGVDDVSVEPAESGGGDLLVVRRNADAEGACCPTALQETKQRLDADQLVQVGDTSNWAIIRVGINDQGETTSDPTIIKFLPGTSRADLTGDATTPVAATFEANAGQTMQLTLDPDALADDPVVVVISGPDGAAGKIGTGFDPSITLKLPSTGTYRLQFDPAGTPDDAGGVYFDADLRVT